jgi:hypothetical protein
MSVEDELNYDVIYAYASSESPTSGEWRLTNDYPLAACDKYILVSRYESLQAELQQAREALEKRNRSTGLTDKNGIEVFEGDLCQIDHSRAINGQRQFTLNRVIFKNAEFIWGADENPNPLQQNFAGCEGGGVCFPIMDGHAFVIKALSPQPPQPVTTIEGYYKELDAGAAQAKSHPAYAEMGRELEAENFDPQDLPLTSFAQHEKDLFIY